jgi:hypothetical protein
MLAFPQLSERAMIQYPYRWRQTFRTRLPENGWGPLSRQSDTGFEERRWTCVMRGLSDAERTAIENLFVAAGGSYRPFTFLSPHENLLADSDSLQSGAWIKDAGLVLATGFGDPLGGTAATRVSNPTAVPKELRQIVSAPSEYRYCASFYGRSTSGGDVVFRGGAIGSPNVKQVRLSTAWLRYIVPVQSMAQEEETTFGLLIPAVTEIEVFGWQVEPSSSATEYKRTVGTGGIINNCRFADDRLEWSTEFAGQHTVKINLAAM